MNLKQKILSVLGASALAGSVQAAPVFFTDVTQWQAAANAAAIGGTASFDLDDLEGQTPGTNLTGPLSFHGGNTTATLNNPGNAGSDVNILAPGSNGTQTLFLEVEHDTSDVTLPFPPFVLPNDGVESIDLSFSVAGAQVVGFAFDVLDQLTTDGLLFSVNGATASVSSLVGVSSNGFFGVVDAAGITVATLLPDDLNNVGTLDVFEEIELDNLQLASSSSTPPDPDPSVPVPSVPLLLLAGMLGLAASRRR